MDRSAYRARAVDAEIDELIGGVAAIALEGAKGVGKTATASQRAKNVRELDDPGQRSIGAADPGRLLQGALPS